MEQLIKKVYKNKGSGQVLVSIPKDSNIKAGDHVAIWKVPDIGYEVSIEELAKAYEHLQKKKEQKEKRIRQNILKRENKQ